MLIDGTVIDELIGKPSGDAFEIPFVSGIFCGSIQAFACPNNSTWLSEDSETVDLIDRWDGLLLRMGWIPCDGRAVQAYHWTQLAARLATDYSEIGTSGEYNVTFKYGQSTTKPIYVKTNGSNKGYWKNNGGTFNVPDLRAYYMSGASATQALGVTARDTVVNHDHAISFSQHTHNCTDPGHGHTPDTTANSAKVILKSGSAYAKDDKCSEFSVTIVSKTTGVAFAEATAGITQANLGGTASDYEHGTIRTNSGGLLEVMRPNSAHVVFAICGGKSSW
jgi:hypothetical protein